MAEKPFFLLKQPTVVHHAINTVGRDYVVGDLHGCLNMLETLLSVVGFDTKVDRLFSVGDLVDRGPDSPGCLALLEKDWFYPVLGNHDAMLIAWIYGKTKDRRQKEYERMFVDNTGWEWVRRWTGASRFLPLLEKVPFVRVIGQEDIGNRYQVAHAELLDVDDLAHSLSDAVLDDEDVRFWDAPHYIRGFGEVGDWRDHLLCGRSLIRDARKAAKKGIAIPETHGGLSTTYVGHTIVPPTFGPLSTAPLCIRQHVYLDAGAFTWYQDNDRKDRQEYGLVLWSPQDDKGLLCGEKGEIRELNAF